ncbi:hypothetical protein L0P88_04330 [Muricauda sp. SCSIO 64092]|uniref:hypothetical protein n=1 Tax=Allomuricauda sp. SCSIO 64092 TaxID=2908842 RepID=UPI001FF10E3A|nr:hypothetical protein [Muricauda sp. SCSIO 64092]UOY07782.1 hypothetical protein L0P88_04330 [Muricauda sp. SCSIO 64092]
MKKNNLLSLLIIIIVFSAKGQKVYNENVTIQPSSYGPKLILNDPNTENKIPIEFRSNNIIKWELGTRRASEQYDLALWRYFNNSYSPVMWFNQDNGNVGIGTTTPNSKLEIESEGVHYNTGASLRIKDVTNRGTIFLESVKDQPTDFVFKNNNRLSWVMSTRGSSDDYALRFFPSQNGTSWSAPSLSLSTNGNIGIGTINTGSWKLAVNGKIRAKEIKVETGWPDFVFYDDYQLPTLDEVENHIQENGHLKDIPTAREVEENGIFLGEMDSKLLQKIEELTLYTIQQEKKIKELESLNKKLLELESRLEKLEAKK